VKVNLGRKGGTSQRFITDGFFD